MIKKSYWVCSTRLTETEEIKNQQIQGENNQQAASNAGRLRDPVTEHIVTTREACGRDNCQKLSAFKKHPFVLI